MSIRKELPKLNRTLFRVQDPVPIEREITRNMPTFTSKRRGNNYKGYIPGVHHPIYYPARNQGTGELILNTLGQIGTEVAGTTLEGFGYLMNVNDYLKPWAQSENSMGEFLKNWDAQTEGHSQGFADSISNAGENLAAWGRDLRKWGRETAVPIHSSPTSGELGDPVWVAQNLPSIASFVGLLIPGAVAARGASALAKFANAGRQLSKTQSFAVNGIAGASASRHAEGMMEGYALYEDLLKQGYSEQEAAAAMAKVYRDNSALFFVDVLQFGYLMGGGGKALRKLFSRSADKRSFWDKSKGVLFQGTTEAGEEGFQHIITKEAEAILAGEDPGFLFAENFINRLDDYYNDTDMHTAMMLGALGGAVAPSVMRVFKQRFQEAPEHSQEYMERLRHEVREMLSDEENDYVDKKHFLVNAMRFANQGRMSDMEDILNSYVEEYASNPDMSAAVERAKQALDLIPEFETIFNEVQNQPDYSRGKEFEHIKDPASHLRTMNVIERFGLKFNEELKNHYDAQYEQVLGALPGFDPQYKKLKEIQESINLADRQLAMGELQNAPEDVISKIQERKDKLQKEYEAELKNLEENDVSVSNIAEKIQTTEDAKIQKILWNRELLDGAIEEQINRLKSFQTSKGQMEYLKEQDESIGEQRDTWLKNRGSYLGEGAIVGNEYNQFIVRQGKDDDRLYLQRITPAEPHNRAPVTESEQNTFLETGSITPNRRLAIVEKLNNKVPLTPIEMEMYRKHATAIDEERQSNLDNNNGQEYSHGELLEHLWDNDMEILDVTEFDKNWDEQVMAQQRQVLENERQDILSQLSDTEQRISHEQGLIADGKEDTTALEKYEAQRDDLGQRLQDNLKAWDQVEDLPYLRRNVIRAQRQTVVEDIQEDLDRMQEAGQRTATDEQNDRKKYAADVYTTLTGAHRKRNDQGEWEDVQTFEDIPRLITDSPSQRRFFKWVDDNAIYGEDYHLKLYPILDANGDVIQENLDMFVPENEREGKDIQEVFKNAVFAVVVNVEGKPLSATGNVLEDGQIAQLGLYTSLIEPTLEAGKRRVMPKEMALIEGEFQRYKKAHEEILTALRGTESQEPQDVFLPVLAKSMGAPVRIANHGIPIAHTSPNPEKAEVRVALGAPIFHQGRPIHFKPGETLMFDSGTGAVTYGFTRSFEPHEVETIYQLMVEGAKVGYNESLPKKRRTYLEALTHYLHWMAPKETNRGGIIYDSQKSGKTYLYMEGFNEEGDNIFEAAEILAKEDEVKGWIRRQVFNVNRQFLTDGNRKKKYSYVTYNAETASFDMQFTQKTYSDFLMDPEQKILMSDLPTYSQDTMQPQRWNSNLIYSMDEINLGKPKKTKVKRQAPTTEEKKGSRQRKPRTAAQRKKSAFDKFTGGSGSAYATVQLAKSIEKLAIAINGGKAARGKSKFTGKGKRSTKKKTTGKKGPQSLNKFSAFLKGQKEDLSDSMKKFAAVARPEAIGEKSDEAPKTKPTDSGMSKFAAFTGTNPSEAPQSGENVEETKETPTPSKKDVSNVRKFFKDREDGDNLNKFNKSIDRTIDDNSMFDGMEYIPENIPEVMAWAEENFPQIDFLAVSNLIKQGKWGTFTEYGQVLIDEFAEQGTLYHEAFHVTSFLFLTPSEQQALYREYRKSYDPNAITDRQAEEGLAEMFRDYMLTGELPESRPIKGFFNRFIAWLQELLGIKPGVLRTFERIHNGYYANMTPNFARKFQYHDRSVKFALAGKSVEFTKEVVNHMHLAFLEEIRQRGLRTAIVEGGMTALELANAYDAVYEKMARLAMDKTAQFLRMQEQFTEAEEVLETEEELLVAQAMIREAQNVAEEQQFALDRFYESTDGPSLIQLHSQFLKTLNITLEESLLDEISTQSDPDNTWAESVIMKSQMLTASNEVRFWLSGVYNVTQNGNIRTTTGHYHQRMEDAFGIIAKELSGTTTVNQQADKLRTLSKAYPGLIDVIIDFGLDHDITSGGKDIRNIAGSDFMRRNKFFQTFAKYRENYYNEMVELNQDYRRAYANNSNLRRQIFTSWEQAYTGELSDETREVFNQNRTSFSFEEAVRALRDFGFDIQGIVSEEFGNSILTPELQGEVADKAFFIARNVYKNPQYNPFEETGDVGALVKIEIKMRPDFSEGSHLNAEGNNVYDNQDYNYMYFLVSSLNNIATHKNENGLSTEDTMNLILEAFPHFRHPYYRTSKILTHVAAGNKIVTSLEEGVVGDRNSMEYRKIAKPDRFIKEILDMNRGVYHLIRPADNSLERTFALSLDEYRDVNNAFFSFEETMGNDAGRFIYEDYAYGVIEQYIKDELAFMEEVYNTNPLMYQNWKNFTRNMQSEDRSRSGIFLSLFSDQRFDTAMDDFIHGLGSLEERQNRFTGNPQIIQQLSDSINQIISSEVEPLVVKYRVKELEFMGTDLSTFSNSEIAKFITLNYMVSMAEQTKFFAGHPAQYKDVDDMVKRMSAIVGPKTLNMVDPNTNNYLHENFNTPSEGAIPVAVVKDPVVASSTVYKTRKKKRPLTGNDVKNIYKELFKQRHKGKSPITSEQYAATKADLYKGFEEGDAHAFMDIEYYREFLMRSGEWDFKQEAAFYWQMEGGWFGEKVVVPADNPFTEIAGREITKSEVEQNGYILRALKPHAFGPWKGSGMMTILKFAVTPLLPEFTSGTQLQTLAEKMTDEDIGITIMDTGNKVGTPILPTGEIQTLWMPDGSMNPEGWVAKDLPWQYMGIQVPNAPKLKSDVSPGTQKDRHVESDLFEYGVPRDFAQNYTRTTKEIPFDKAIESILIPDEVVIEGEFELYEWDAEGGMKSMYKYDAVKNPDPKVTDAYGEQVAVLKDAQAAFEGILHESPMYKNLQPGKIAQLPMAMELLNNALFNINNIRSKGGLDKVNLNDIKEQILPNYVTEYVTSGTDYVGAREAWDTMSEADRRASSPSYRLISDLRNIEEANIEYGLMTIKEKLGLEEVRENGELMGYRISEQKIDRAKAFLLNEMTKRDLPPNMLESVQWLDGGTDYMVNSQEVEVILKSVMTKATINRKLHGKNMVLVPATMQEMKRVPFFEDADGTYFASSDLRIYEDDSGNITAMEVYMPHYFKELLGENIDINKLDPKLREIIGFRIPTQALSSLESIYIKDFLPVTAGDSIIAPSEIVVKTGADFDWDKLFVHLPNYVIRDGNIEYANYVTEESQFDKLWQRRKYEFVREMAPDRVADIYNKEREENEAPVDMAALENLAEAMVTSNEEMNKSRRKQIQDEMAELYKEFRPIWDGMSTAFKNGHSRLDNRKMEIQHELIRMSNRFAQLMSPVTASVGASLLKDYSVKLAEARDEQLKQLMGEEEYGRQRSIEGHASLGNMAFMLEKGYQLLVSKQNISTAALAGTAHINYAQVNVFLDNVRIALRHNMHRESGDTYPSMAGVLDARGEHYISDIINELLTAYVDSAKDPFIFDINGAGDNAMVFATMIVLGVPIEDVIGFMNQPIIAWYNDELDFQKSAYFRATRYKGDKIWKGQRQFTKDFIKRYREQFPVPRFPNPEHLQNTKRLWKNAGIPYVLDSSGKPRFTGAWDHELQYTALRQYLDLKDLAGDFMGHITASTYNTKRGGKNILSAMLLDRSTDILINRELDERRFVNYDKLFKGDGFLAPHRKAVQEMIQMLKPFHAFTADSMLDVLDDMMNKMLRSSASMEDNMRVLDRFRNELGTAIYQVYQPNGRNLWSNYHELILSHPYLQDKGDFDLRMRNFTVPRQVVEMQNEIELAKEDPTIKRRPNFLVENLVVHMKNTAPQNKRIRVDNLSLRTISGRKANAIETQRLTDAWRELERSDYEFSRNLFRFLMMQSGLSPSSNNFLRIVPHEIYYDEMAPALDKFANAEGPHRWFYKQFALNNRDARVYRTTPKMLKKESAQPADPWPFTRQGRRGNTYLLDGEKLNLGETFAFSSMRTYGSAKMYQYSDTDSQQIEEAKKAMEPKKKPRRQERSAILKERSC